MLKDYDENVMHSLIEPTFELLAQRIGRGAVPGVDYNAFMTVPGTVARWPGRKFLR
ncbi:hypothetical protein AAGW05_03075 [Arthrobacter sp. LAPM80]|uniref:hypothetical protein n=1 Tax=Arthrobacter sp. LAPM80 TaxID=3141788 RepID=UPI00398A630B